MTQTALPSATVSNDWTVTGPSAWEALRVSDGDTAKIQTSVENDLCIVNIESLSDPKNNINHVITISAKAAGSGGPERIQLKLFEGATERAVSSNIAITRGSYNDFTFTLSTAQADSITDYTILRISIDAVILGVESLDVSFAKFEVDDAPTGFAHSQGYVI